ncbi:MAG TPA: phenylacetate--CoA ligase [Thermoclostridium sp.]|nr:phenylacetate--CoA ligase [Clostridiaceae bacterium]HOQ76846.1 phenylacetate--CoA ligase [Thermoclostridium sp.]
MAGYWNAEIETMDIEALKKLQGERLKATVERVYKNVPYYAEKMKRAGVTPDDINGIEDLKKLPFTYKDDLRNNYPYGMFAVPMDQVVRIHASSGTTGKMTVVGYTQNDIGVWAECIARSLVNVGVTDKDIVHVAYGYGLFTGGLGLHYGAEKIGATVVPVSGGNTKRQVQLLQDFKATVLCCTPSYALYIADEMAELGVKKEDLSLRVGIFGAEPWSEEMRRQIEERLGIKAYDIYGLSEIIGPGVAMDCECQTGLHIMADHFIPEVIDPVTEEVLPEGSKGELVFTCITKEALPLIRYRTRDLTILDWEKCPCGRTSPRMLRVTGRSDDMLIIRGVNVFPSQVESVLLKYSEVEPHYMIVVDRKDNLDVMEIQIEVTNGLFSDEIRKLEALERTIRDDIESTLGIHAKVRLVEHKTIQRSEGKAKRVIDKRQLYK